MNVLMVEDDPLAAAALYDFLVGRGHVVSSICDRAMPLVLGAGQRFDAIILNRSLIELGRSAIIDGLRDAGHWAPIIALDSSDPGDPMTGYEGDGGDFHASSASLGDLLEQLSALGGRVFFLEASSAA